MTTDIRDVLDAILADDQVTELRMFKGGKPYFGYFTDLRHMAELAADADGKETDGIYLVMNPIDPAVLESTRALNKIEPAEKGDTTKDVDILCRRWLLIDLDPERETGVSATDDEKRAALERKDALRDYLSSRGWPDPIEGDSGNGAHLLYRIDLPTDDTGLCRGVLHALHRLFSDDVVKVDTTVHNPSRIWKLYGTTARKGTNTPERPHRRSGLIHVPDTLSRH